MTAVMHIVRSTKEEVEVTVTDIELDLIRRLCLPNKVIAQEMGISVYSVKKRVERLLVKLDVENRAAVVLKAIRCGILSTDDFAQRGRYV